MSFVLDKTSYRSRHILSTSAVVTTVATSKKFLAIALSDGKVHIFTINPIKLLCVLSNDNSIWALGIQGNTLIAGGVKGELNAWDIISGTKRCSFQGHTNTVRCLHFPSASRAITGSRDSTLRSWDLEERSCERVFEGHEKTVRVVISRRMPYNPGNSSSASEPAQIPLYGELVVSGSYDGDARVWNLDSGECIHVLKGHTKQIYCVVFDGEKVATGSGDGSVRLWNMRSGECLAVLKDTTESLIAQMMLVGDKLVIASATGVLRVYNWESHKELLRVAAHDTSIVALTCDNRRIFTGSSDGGVKMWDIETGAFIREVISGVEAVWQLAILEDTLLAMYSKGGNVVLEASLSQS